MERRSKSDRKKEGIRGCLLFYLCLGLKLQLFNNGLCRLVHIIVFHQLTKDDINEIAKRLLDNLSRRVKGLEMELDFSDEAVSAIADAGFDPVYGARPLRRAIQQRIEDKLSEQMLEGKLKSGKKYYCDYKDGSFEFNQI